MDKGQDTPRNPYLVYWLAVPLAAGLVAAGVATQYSEGEDTAALDEPAPVQSAVALPPDAVQETTASIQVPLEIAEAEPEPTPELFTNNLSAQSCPADARSRDGSSIPLSSRLWGWTSGSGSACGIRGSIEAGLRQSMDLVVGTVVRFCGTFFPKG